ncbi:MAG: beta-aspartyl-peptidase, partial [bacterium]
MLKLIKNAEVYAPKYLGKRDVLITADKIGYIEKSIDMSKEVEIETIDAEGKFLVPGFIDSHVHILGGGGEGSYKTRTPEITLSELTRAGITTVVGCLGIDGTTRTMSNLIAKARGLEEEGITSYVYTGSYQVPVRTIMGSILDDIILIDKIIGVGEIAISDHRSSQPTIEEIAKIAAEARVGGMLSGKAGVVNVHMGDGNRKLSFLEEIVNTTEIPITQFIPTHVERTRDLFESAIEYAKKGGLIDLTTSTSRKSLENRDITSGELLKIALDSGVSVENVSFSSDGQGSLPIFDEKRECVGLGVGDVSSLFNEVREAIKSKNIPMQNALKVITSNPAKNLKLHNKGSIQIGRDADLVLLDKDLEIDTVIAKAQIMIRNKGILVKGT